MLFSGAGRILRNNRVAMVTTEMPGNGEVATSSEDKSDVTEDALTSSAAGNDVIKAKKSKTRKHVCSLNFYFKYIF